MLTPVRIQLSLIRSRMIAAASASCTRSFTPRMSSESAETWAFTTSPSAVIMLTTSVRYSSL